jgi:hypothetical protein
MTEVSEDRSSLSQAMKWMRVLFFLGLVAAGFYYRAQLQSFASGFSANLLRVSKHEKEVGRVFAAYTELLTHGDPRSENVYLPNATVLFTRAESGGHHRQVTQTAAEHRALSQTVLPRIKAGQIKVRFADVQCREQSDGKVRVTFAAYLDEGLPERVSMLFVNTAPHIWAVAEETHSPP